MIDTTLIPDEVYRKTSQIENDLGRSRKEKWGPRTIDIDILYYGSEIVVTKDLKIPHPEIQKRRFTLVPLTEIYPNFIHPVLNLSQLDLLKHCADLSEVNLLKTI